MFISKSLLEVDDPVKTKQGSLVGSRSDLNFTTSPDTHFLSDIGDTTSTSSIWL